MKKILGCMANWLGPVVMMVAVSGSAPLGHAAVEVAPTREMRDVVGWRVLIHAALWPSQTVEKERVLGLLATQLGEIVRVVPAAAVAEMRKVPLYFSPEYEGIRPAAEYHPGAEWLRANGRDPAMARGVEFTNTRVFEAECRRMPAFALHELVHAYHDQVLGFDHVGVEAAYQKAKAAGIYEKVDQKDAEGRKHQTRAYALTNAKEYFAEGSEAYFSTNDFFPHTRAELERHDPVLYALLTQIWGTPVAASPAATSEKP